MSTLQRKAFKQLSNDIAAVREAVADATVLGDQARGFSQAADTILCEAGLEILRSRNAPAQKPSAGTDDELANAFPQAHAAMADLTDALYALGERCMGEGIDGPLETAQAMFKAVEGLRPGYRSLNALQIVCGKLMTARDFIRKGNFDAAKKIIPDVREYEDDLRSSIAIASTSSAEKENDWLWLRQQLLRELEKLPGNEKLLSKLRDAERKINQLTEPKTIRLPNGKVIELRKVLAGQFLYGDNKMQTRTGEYWIGKTPVTEGQFAAFAKATGHRGDDITDNCIAHGGDYPMTHINCTDAEAFCRWLSEISGLKVRLPKEQEWEKAARGTDGRTYPWGEEAPSSRLCNISGSGPGAITPVGSFPAGNSPYGCEDMAGNVREWTSSNWEGGGYRVLRGGSWNDNANNARCASRVNNDPDFRSSKYNYGFIGFRVCASPI